LFLTAQKFNKASSDRRLFIAEMNVSPGSSGLTVTPNDETIESVMHDERNILKASTGWFVLCICAERSNAFLHL
jgi:hypothetical protein